MEQTSKPQPPVYRERFLPIKRAIQYIQLSIYAVPCFGFVITMNVVFANRADFTSQLWPAYVILLIISVFAFVRTRWLWYNTYLIANSGRVAIERPSSLALLVLARKPSIRTKGIEYCVPVQRPIDLILTKIFRIESWTITLDTAADEKNDFKVIKYVKDAERFRAIIHPDEI